MWAAKNHPVRRLYFCYPTTGTATEGFKDYLFPPGAEADEVDPAAGLIRKIGAKLFHSRREIDLEIILGAGQDLDPAPSDVAVRLDSLEAWATPVVACTVDAVLGVIQNNKRGLFGWPALAQSAFVFDEIHAYDERLFGALLRFLRDLPGIPTLLMTASLPAPREEALRILLTSRGHEWIPIAGPDELELMPRYHRRCVAENDPLPLIRETLANGGKVLWVCNTVARVMDAADRTLDLAPLVYHSRFRYVDRVNRHNAVVRAFRPENRGASLAVCSQVAEMSLDLKGCTLLVTDLASVPALIQRLGRLNREAMPGDPTRPFVIIEPDDTLPYTSNDLTTARDWLARLRDDAISQRAIANAWEQGDEEPAVPCASAWLDGGPSTTVTELRELSPGISVILGADRSCVRKSSDITRFVIPMPPPPRRVTWHDWPRVRGIPVAPGDLIAYNPERGAQWRV
jgi:CRISPR-associated endonuclease/helicase Cas3